MSKVMKNCEECGKPGGTIPKYYWDGVVGKLHPVCAANQMRKYLARKESQQ
jgi:hypothetical protein